MYEVANVTSCSKKHAHKTCRSDSSHRHKHCNPQNVPSLWNKNGVGAFIPEKHSEQWEKTEWKKVPSKGKKMSRTGLKQQ